MKPSPFVSRRSKRSRVLVPVAPRAGRCVAPAFILSDSIVPGWLVVPGWRFAMSGASAPPPLPLPPPAWATTMLSLAADAATGSANTPATATAIKVLIITISRE